MAYYHYETYSVPRGSEGRGILIDQYSRANEAIHAGLTQWPEDADHDIEVMRVDWDNPDLTEHRTRIGSIRHDHSDPLIATVWCPLVVGKEARVLYRCQYVEITGRIHTNIFALQEDE